MTQPKPDLTQTGYNEFGKLRIPDIAFHVFKTGVFRNYATFSNLFLSKSPPIFTRIQKFSEHRGLLRVVGIMRHTEDIFLGKNRFLMFSAAQDRFFAVSSWENSFRAFCISLRVFLALQN